MLNVLFSKIVYESRINDSAAQKIENLIKLCVENSTTASFKAYSKNELKVSKSYLICNNCTSIKKSAHCVKCLAKTASNNFTLFDIEDQAKKIIDANLSELKCYQQDISKLGYLENSLISKFHKKNNGLTLTMNMDGVSIFSNNSKDTWPIYLAFNEFSMKTKFAPQNVILAGIWCGQTKINNYEIIDDAMKAIKSLENGVSVANEIYKIYVLCGSFDKPAKSLAYNAQSCTAKNGCMFCFGKCIRICRRPVYLKKGKPRSHKEQINCAAKA